jgi:TrmH family RNA methyltransferase
MLTENIRKHIKKLQQKKYRREFGEFIIEGIKGVEEVLASGCMVTQIILEEDSRTPVDLPLFVAGGPEVLYASKSDIKDIKTTETFPGIMAVVKMPETKLQDFDLEKPILCLDGVKDPGNLGTIIRTADWFGITNILLTDDCVDAYNEKVVRSTMGSIFRSKIVESENIMQDLPALKKQGYTLIGLEMEGEPLQKMKPQAKTVYVFGSESHGISAKVQSILDSSCTIPRLGGSESLNVGVAVGVVLSKISL